MAASVSPNSEIGRVIRDSGGGVLAEPENARELAATIRQFHDDPVKRAAIGERGRLYALRYWSQTRVFSDFNARLRDVSAATTKKPVVGTPISVS